jgi:hypothetical protein
VGWFDWLFGKKERPFAAAGPARQESALAEKEPPVQLGHGVAQGPPPSAPPRPERPVTARSEPTRPPLPPEAENVRRWRESGQARSWVESHQGRWDHQEWLALLDELRRSPFWPMHPDAVGTVLEEVRREWSQRN